MHLPSLFMLCSSTLAIPIKVNWKLSNAAPKPQPTSDSEQQEWSQFRDMDTEDSSHNWEDSTSSDHPFPFQPDVPTSSSPPSRRRERVPGYVYNDDVYDAPITGYHADIGGNNARNPSADPDDYMGMNAALTSLEMDASSALDYLDEDDPILHNSALNHGIFNQTERNIQLDNISPIGGNNARNPSADPDDYMGMNAALTSLEMDASSALDYLDEDDPILHDSALNHGIFNQTERNIQLDNISPNPLQYGLSSSLPARSFYPISQEIQDKADALNELPKALSYSALGPQQERELLNFQHDLKEDEDAALKFGLRKSLPLSRSFKGLPQQQYPPGGK